MNQVLRMGRAVPATGSYKGDPELAPFVRNLKAIIAGAVKAAYLPQRPGVVETHETAKMIRSGIQDLYDAAQRRIGELVGIVEKKLATFGDASRLAQLSSTAYDIASKANGTQVLNALERALSVGQLNFANELLVAGKTFAKITGGENQGVEDRFHGLLGTIEVGQGIRAWRNFQDTLQMYADVCADVASEQAKNEYAASMIDPLPTRFLELAKLADPRTFGMAWSGVSDEHIFAEDQ